MRASKILAAAVAISALTCACYWSARLFMERMRLEQKGATDDRGSAYPLRGYSLDLSTGAQCDRDQEPQSRRRQLLLLASTTCNVSAGEGAAWSRIFAHGLPASIGVTLVRVGHEDPFTAIEDQLRKNGVGVRRCTVRNRVAFGMATGLTATPTTAVLDSHGRVELVWSQALTPRTEAIIRDHLVNSR